MFSVRKSVKRLTDRFLLPEEATISGIDLCRKFNANPRGSLKALLTLMNQIADSARPMGGSTHPYFRRQTPDPQDYRDYDSDSNPLAPHIDLRHVVVPPGRIPDESASSLDEAIAKFDARAASVILDSAQPTFIHKQQEIAFGVLIDPGFILNKVFLEEKNYRSVPKFYTLSASSLAMMAYDDFFPNDDRRLVAAIPDVPNLPPNPPTAPGWPGEPIGKYLRDLVNVGIMNASPGYCGAFGPGGLIELQLHDEEGNYDMTQIHLIPLAYSYYDELSGDAREHLIGQLLAGGIYHRENEPEIKTSGPLPDDWTRAGYIAPSDLSALAGAAAAAAAAAKAAAEAAGAAVATAPIAAAAAAAAVAAAITAVFGADPVKSLKDIGETENHLISMLSTRYLTNQLLYQRDPKPDYDNRRNAKGGPTCMSLVLSELRNILRDDFSEYNAKSYQEETRWPILNLATYAYDHEVRLAARMVLDYISAHIVVSSNDLRRIVPFRRRNEGNNVRQENAHMAVGLLDAPWLGADPLAAYFAIQAGNLRAYETPNFDPMDPDHPDTSPAVRPWIWGIANGGGDVTKEVLSSYRLPPLIHDLFVNDLHRRFFQRLHRTLQKEAEGSRNCDNYELYASSPSYLITAGGQPATYAIDPRIGSFTPPGQDQQKGVGMPTTFMPTGQSAGSGTQNSAKELIQFSYFSADFDYQGKGIPEYLNYGVAPDFACGYGLYLPQWAKSKLSPPLSNVPGFHFIDCGSDGTSAGFYLAIFKDGDYALLEALDTWLHPEVTFENFRTTVQAQNSGLNLHLPDSGGGDQGGVYTTYFGTQIGFVIWRDHTNVRSPDSKAGAYTGSIVYSNVYPADSQGDAGNAIGPFLNGTILNSPREAVVEISNPFYEPMETRNGPLGGKIVLDLNDPMHPRRTSETGEVEEAGGNNEVWVNFGWTGPTEGDFFDPFNTLTAAVNAVAAGGVIKIVPGWTNERPIFVGKKPYKIVAPIGGVRIGVQ